jgi:hypothetical protein
MRSGQTALSYVLLVGAIIALFGTTLAFLSFTFSGSSFGIIRGQQTLSVASAGADDAMLQLVRNKSFSSGGYSVPIVLNGTTYNATVAVTQNTPVSGQVTVVSTAAIGNHQRQIRIVLSVASTTGQIDQVSRQIASF